MIQEIICMATHDYQWQLTPFVYLLRKYWGRAIHIVYYCDKVIGDLPKCVEVRQVPLMKERGEEHWSFQRDFGAGFISILRELSDSVVAVSMMDYWLVRPANLDMIDGMARYMEAHHNVVRTALGIVKGADPWSRCVETWEGMDVMTCNPRNNFNAGIMFNVGLFNRERILEIYRNTSVLESEIMGWKVMQEHPELMSVWVRDAIGMYDYAHTTISTECDKSLVMHIPSSEDRDVVKLMLPDHIRPQEV